MDPLISYTSLFSFTKAIFVSMGCSEKNAFIATESLLIADLRGVDSHGIARLIGYIRLWEASRINTAADIKIIHETPSTATIDGDAGLGLIIAPFAMNVAIDKARIAGTGWVAVKNSNHFGIAGSSAMMALEHDMIGIAMTNASAIVAPTFSIERLLGTNPIAVAIPAGNEQPFIADFATTTAANGKLELLQRKNEMAPNGWVQTKDGNPSNNANELKYNGALLPLGSDREHGSHKGYCLGSIVDIFSGVLSGANYGPWVPPFPAYIPMPEDLPGQGIGHFFGAMRIDAFRPATAFKDNMDQWIKRFKRATPVAGEAKVFIPGEIESEMMKERMLIGIPLPPTVLEDLHFISKKFDVPFPDHLENAMA